MRDVRDGDNIEVTYRGKALLDEDGYLLAVQYNGASPVYVSRTEGRTVSVSRPVTDLNLITFYEYQESARATDVVQDKTDRIGHLQYLALGLNGEAGEVADKVKKLVRDNNGQYTAFDEDAIAKELGDVLWYLARLADVLSYTLDTVALDNVNKLRSRQNRGVLGGNGDNR